MQLLHNSLENQNNEFITLPTIEEVPNNPGENIKQVETKWQDTPFFQYFASKAKDKQRFLEVEQLYNKNLQKKLQNQIQEGTTTVSKKKNMKLSTKKQETEQEKYLREKHELECKKKIFKQSLNRVFEEEKKIISKNINILRNSRKRNQPHFQEMNPRQKQDVFQSLKKLKQLEKILKEKDKSLEEKINSLRLDDIVHKTKSIDTMRVRNKIQVIQKKQKYQSLKEKEIKERKKCQLLVIKMKPQSYKFQKLEEMRRKQLQIMESQRKFQEETARKQRTTLSRKELQAHEQAYLQIVNQRKQRWITQLQSLKATNRAQQRQYSGFFLQKVIREQSKMREQIQEKQQNKIQVIKKAKDYSQYVKECFRPKITKTQNPEKQLKNHSSLTRIQERTKGIENLNFVKQKINSIKKYTQKQQSNVQKTMSLPKLNSKTLYRDYLKEQPSRIKRELSVKSGFETVLTERKSDWLQNAYSYLEKLESKEATKKGKPLIETAFRKLQLLNALY